MCFTLVEMKYTTVLWDLDGTILNSGPGVFDSFRKTFDAINFPQPTDAQLRTFIGPPLRDTFRDILGFTPEQTQRALEVYRDFYLAGGALNAHLYEGVVEVIARAKALGITNSLATSKAISGVTVVGEHYDFLKHFDFLGTADVTANRLSKTDVITYALDGLRGIGADLSSVVLIGDRIHDIEGARHHGIEVALVRWGYGNTDEWALADHQIGSAAELAEFLGLSTSRSIITKVQTLKKD
jgi:phosphoglycolate phosphatase